MTNKQKDRKHKGEGGVRLSIAPNGPQDQSTIDVSDNAALLELFANSFVKGESRDESAEEKVQCSDKYENLQRRMLMRERPLATTVRTRTCRCLFLRSAKQSRFLSSQS